MQPAPPPAAALAANREGMAALDAGDAASALTAFARATAADPSAGPLWKNLAHACRLLGDDAGERGALDSALALDRTDFVAQLRLAQLLQRTGKERDALLAWDGVRQLAARLPETAPALAEELAAGELYSNGLRSRLAAVADAVIASSAGAGETQARRIAAFADHAAGRRHVYANACAGLYYPFLPADEFFDARHFPWFAELEAGAGAIRSELDALLAAPGEALRPYIRQEYGTPPNDWSALDGSLDWAACFLWEYGAANPAVIERCPQTAALLEALPLARIPGRGPNAFFSMLRAGKRIPAHTGVTNTRAIVHLALDAPPRCGFRVGGETREWVEGKAFAFDDTIEHEAWNDSDRSRSVLILDVWNPHLSPRECEAIAAYFEASDKSLA